MMLAQGEREKAAAATLRSNQRVDGKALIMCELFQGYVKLEEPIITRTKAVIGALIAL